jgi:RecQ-mediated genome instability protein 1
MAIGAKLVLRDFEVARGVVLLEPRCVEVLGGKVDASDRKWRDERKKVLKEKAGMGT